MIHVDDLSTLNPFEGATNRTSVVVLEKGGKTTYPVPYTYWRKRIKGRGLNYESTLDETIALTARANFQAVPVDLADETSAWLTGRPGALKAFRKYTGKSEYQARIGVKASSNGIFWLERLANLPEGKLIARNMAEVGRIHVESLTVDLEADLVYPLLRGRDVRRWTAEPSAHILLTHLPGNRLKAIPQQDMERLYPRTFSYLKRFEKTLLRTGLIRRFYTKKNSQGSSVASGPFYSMFNIGDYSFAPYKVVWREISTSLIAAVSGPRSGQTVISDHKLVLAPFAEAYEAHYVCALLNSSPANLLVVSYTVPTQISTHIFDHLAVPRFNPDNHLHIELSGLSAKAHSAVARDAPQRLREFEDRIDRLSAHLWGFSESELSDIRQNLRELVGPVPKSPDA